MGITSKDKLKKEAEKEITIMFETILDYAQVACAQPEVYKALRSRVLRAGNDCIRALKGVVDMYSVDYIPTTEDVIEVTRKTNNKGKGVKSNG